MKSDLRISVDLSELLAVGPVARAGIFGNLSAAVESVAQAGVERWQRAALKAPLWDGERRAYAASIRYQMTGPYSAEVESDYKYVEDIETGRPAYDMKRMLDTSLKVRISKKGRRYLIIPIRHNTPGNVALAPAMPKKVYQAAVKMDVSRIVGGGRRISGTGAWDPKTRAPAMVERRKYVWGGRMEAGMAPKLKKTHRSDPYAGMVKMNTSSGGQTSSAYLTFRVMVEGSSGWVRKPTAGLFIAQHVADSMRRTAESDFSAAIARDIA